MSDIKSDKSEVLHYDNPDFPVFVRRNYISQAGNLEDVFIHWHDELEFIYVLNGDCRYLINGERITIRAGEGIFVNSRQLHRILIGSTDCELLCLIFSPMILCATKYVTGKLVQPILTAGDLPYLLLKDDVVWQRAILNGIADIYQSTVKGDEELEVIAHLYSLWRQIVKNVSVWENKKDTDDDALMRVKTMIGFIQSSFDERVSLRDICESGSMGKNKCTALFKKYTNMSPVDYLRNYRVEKSMELLKHTDMTITEIAYAIGFTGASYYAETFRKYVSCSPMQFRENYREEKS